jgi:hypothetical protein
VRRVGEDRLVEHVFPIAGEFLLGSNGGCERAGAPAGAAEHDALADLRGGGRADRKRRQVDAAERLHQPEAGFGVEAERMALRHAAVAEMQPDRLRLGDQIADGEHQTVADQHAVAGAFGAERVGGEGVGGNDRMQPDHRGQRALEIIAIVLRARLRRGWYLPFGQRGHAGAFPSIPYHTQSSAREKPGRA